MNCKSSNDRDKLLSLILYTKSKFRRHSDSANNNDTDGLNNGKGNSSNKIGGKIGKNTSSSHSHEAKLGKQIELSVDQCLHACKNVRNPTKMLKYCQTGGSIFSRLKKPHYRKFIISSDETKIQWWSKNKKMKESSILIDDINELVEGQTTPAFANFPKPTAEGLSFSLLHGKGHFDGSNMWTGKTLDVICENKKQYQTWVRALRFVIADRRGTAYTRFNSETKNKQNEMSLNALQIDIVKERMKNKERFSELGDVYSWGKGESGGLGHGDTNYYFSPKIIFTLLLVDVKTVSIGLNGGCCLLTSGVVLSFGENDTGKLGHGNYSNIYDPKPISRLKHTKIKQVSLGINHTLFLDEDGNVYSCGNNDCGQLGNPKIKGNINTPMKLSSLKNKIKLISCGAKHSAAVDVDGKLYTWGDGTDGQLGTGKKEIKKTPALVNGLLKGKKVELVSLGCWHSIVKTEDNLLFSFGDNGFGQLGLGKPQNNEKKMQSSLVPVKVKMNSGVIQSISCGDYHSGCVKDGRIFVWGSGMYGQIGNGKKNKENNTPIKILKYLDQDRKEVSINDYKCVSLSLGANHTLALVELKGVKKKFNKVLSWGAGTYGRVGDGGEVDQSYPIELSFFNEKEVREVQAGNFSSFCVCSHQWIPDKDVKRCMNKNCDEKFTFTKRRHHCRNCGGIFCENCSDKKIVIMNLGFDKNVRVCGTCYPILKSQMG